MIQQIRSYLAVLGMGIAVVLGGCGTGETRTVTVHGDVSFSNEADKPTQYKLDDGSLLVLSPKAKVTMDVNFGKGSRDLTLDGEALLIVEKVKGDSFVVHTKNLNITVLEPSKLHIEAHSVNAGEQTDLLEGKLRVTKTYHSQTDNQPEMLESGDLVMINRDIDLMEKEKMNAQELAVLKKRFDF